MAVRRRLRAMNPNVVVRGVLLIVSLVAIGAAVRASGLGSALDEGWIDSQIRGQGVSGELLFVAVGVLATAVGFPRQVISFLGGYAFGAAEGTLLAVAATLGGCIATFAYARLLGRDLVVHRYPHRIRRADDFLRDNPLLMTLVVRSLPVGSNILTSLVAGVTSVPALPFFVGSAIGYIPQNAAFALAGSGVHLDPAVRVGLAIALLVASSVLGVYLYRRYRHGRSFDEAIERAVDDTGEDDAEASLPPARPGSPEGV